MHIEYHRWYSPRLGQDMELKVYGHFGKPIMVFPCSEGRFFDYENHGMLEVLGPYIEAGRVKLIAVDSIDRQTWFSHHAHPHERGRRYERYLSYIVEEAVPFVRSHCHSPGIRLMAHGCSFGAYHSAVVALRFPWLFDSALLLSGVYSLNFSVGDYVDEGVYLSDPLKFVPRLYDPWYLDQLRRNSLVLVCGQGAWEEWSLDESNRLSAALQSIGVPHWYDVWGQEVDHDWPWWKVQVPYFLDRMGV